MTQTHTGRDMCILRNTSSENSDCVLVACRGCALQILLVPGQGNPRQLRGAICEAMRPILGVLAFTLLMFGGVSQSVRWPGKGTARPPASPGAQREHADSCGSRPPEWQPSAPVGRRSWAAQFTGFAPRVARYGGQTYRLF